MKAIFLFFALFFGCEKKEEPKPSSQEKEALKVIVHEVREDQLFETLAFGGRLEPSSKVNLYAKAHGTVTDIYVKLGDKIKKNQRLMKVSPKDINFRVKCDVLKIPSEDYYKDHISNLEGLDDLYSGKGEIFLEKNQIDEFFSNESIHDKVLGSFVEKVSAL